MEKLTSPQQRFSHLAPHVSVGQALHSLQVPGTQSLVSAQGRSAMFKNRLVVSSGLPPILISVAAFISVSLKGQCFERDFQLSFEINS